MYCVYIIYSSSLNKFYIGYSSNFEERALYHNSKTKNKIWSRRGIPWQEWLVIDGLSLRQARGIESHIKRMKSRKYIENLLKYPGLVNKLKMKYA